MADEDATLPKTIFEEKIQWLEKWKSSEKN